MEDAILPMSEEQWLISPKENSADQKICCATCAQMRTELEEVKKRLVIAENLLNLLLKQGDIANKEKDEGEEGDDGEEVEDLWEEEPRTEKKRKDTLEKEDDMGDKQLSSIPSIIKRVKRQPRERKASYLKLDPRFETIPPTKKSKTVPPSQAKQDSLQFEEDENLIKNFLEESISS